jgi:hypothetical protein
LYYVPGTRYKVQSMEQHAGLDPTWYLVPCTSYLVQWSLATWYWLLDTFSNIERWTPIDEWRSGDLCSDSNGTSVGTWYMVLRTSYNEVLLLDTDYLLLFLISNAELRFKNEEVGICVPTQMELWKLLGTLYLVLRTMKSCYLILTTWYFFPISNAQRRFKNEEVGICVPTQMELRKVLGTLYLVLRTMKSCY